MKIKRFNPVGLLEYDKWLVTGTTSPKLLPSCVKELDQLRYTLSKNIPLTSFIIQELKIYFLMVHNLKQFSPEISPARQILSCGCAKPVFWNACLAPEKYPDDAQKLYGLLKYSYVISTADNQRGPSVCGTIDWHLPPPTQFKCFLCDLPCPSRVCHGGHLLCYSCGMGRVCLECGAPTVILKNK